MFVRKLCLAFGLAALQFAPASAIEPDGPHIEFAKRNAEAWSEQDKATNAKLAALEKKFGKKPNIVYILTDDIGWGELGWQGGGKHRGTPSPALDKMAQEGMRFWSAYAEPSCTPTRIAIMTGRHPVRTGLLSVLWPGMTEGLSYIFSLVVPNLDRRQNTGLASFQSGERSHVYV